MQPEKSHPTEQSYSEAYGELYRKPIEQICSEAYGELYRKLADYAGTDYYPFHMPGHKRREIGSFPATGAADRTDASTCSGKTSGKPNGSACGPAALDITEITGFDDLHHPEGILKTAQEQMADVFGAHKSFYLVNGSTAGILAAIFACTRQGGRILMARNCHKSVYHAACLRELHIDYIDPPVTGWGFAGSIPPEAVRLALEAGTESIQKTVGSVQKAAGSVHMAHDADDRTTYSALRQPVYDAVIITSPTYDGIVSDVRMIAALVHAHGIPLIIDAAHGAHFGFSEQFPERALTCGADIAIESLHKTLPACTQSAALHLADSPYVDDTKIRRYLSIFQTSSPSYPLMAGIDRCVQLLHAEGPRLFSNYEKRLASFYREAASLEKICVFGNTASQNQIRAFENAESTTAKRLIYGKDSSKILISGDAAGLDGPALFAELRDTYHLELEMASLHYVTALTSIMDTTDGFERLLRALQELDRRSGADRPDASDVAAANQADSISAIHTPAGGDSNTISSNFTLSVLADSPTDTDSIPLYAAFDQPSRLCLLKDCADMFSADFIIPYPPGIPFLVPGERITTAHVAEIISYLERGLTVYGVE